MSIRVILADDHAIVRSGLSKVLSSQPDVAVVGEAPNGHLAVQMVQSLLPDVVILDVTMPELNGLDAARAIRDLHSKVGVIIMSIHHSPQMMKEALAAGADAYLQKDSSSDDLIRTVRAVYDQRMPHRARRTTKQRSVDEKQRNADVSASSPLTSRERQVLQLIAEGKANKEIARDFGVSVRTVEAHRAQVMKKLQIYSVAELTRYAVVKGLTPLDP